MKDWRITDYKITNTDHHDGHDYHIVNAALAGQTDYLVTNDKAFSRGLNLDDFPFEILSSDEFLCLVYESAPELCLQVSHDELRYWQTKKQTDPSIAVNLPKTLRNAGCPIFAEKVRHMVLQINDETYRC
ncbi:hypothetical protein [Corynebacterium cystitidis]|uniref:PIN domain-containing protein n=1 Tax=Corynebacterium cystitidis DSM 20524 TaxID=1121357 RepID=A0A1H9UNJ0_9CORY|nr:hypothetical protein [Corynebacterium cystitidis]WJY81049.1 hypothetical protein CCYS_00325 [Corynebacterium cystitidis DSM 20524]SES10851.1 hypothetical protein SAMN05661109_01892 [Corynebacterium cystitidis DSM 20524]SNV90409.1 Uncharacterised protein [Corynebacterium cystitidis]